MRICFASGWDVETQWAKCKKAPKRARLTSEPEWSYQASAEAILHESHEVAGRRRFAKQVLKLQDLPRRINANDELVVCEPTGGYDEELLRLARKQGHRTPYVNTEHSAKMSTVESGDTNKTDLADAWAMSLVAQVDRTQAHRTLEYEYGLLRELGQMYGVATSSQFS